MGPTHLLFLFLLVSFLSSLFVLLFATEGSGSGRRRAGGVGGQRPAKWSGVAAAGERASEAARRRARGWQSRTVVFRGTCASGTCVAVLWMSCLSPSLPFSPSPATSLPKRQ